MTVFFNTGADFLSAAAYDGVTHDPPTASDPAGGTTTANNETSHKIVAGDSLWKLSIEYYGVANEQTYAAIALANPKQFNRGVPPGDQILHRGVTLKILSATSVSEIQTVQKDYGVVQSAGAAIAGAKQLPPINGRIPHVATQDYLNSLQTQLSQAQTQLSTDLQQLLLPDPTRGYLAGAGDAGAAELKSILPDPGLQPYIQAATRSLQQSLERLFGKSSDPDSLGVELHNGDWTAAEHTEEQQIAAAGAGITDPTDRQTAMSSYAQELLSFGPMSPQYQAAVNQAFDNVVVEPLVKSLTNLYANPASQTPHPSSTNASGFDSRAGAFATAFEAAMASATPQVRVALVQDLLSEKNSPLLQAAAQIRAASNQSLSDSVPLVTGYWRQGLGVSPGLSVPPASATTIDHWQISSIPELDQAYGDLAAGLDFVAVSDTVGTGTGMIHQVAQSIVGDPKSAGGLNLQALAPSIQNAAAAGNINLSAEIAGCLNQSGRSTNASSVLTDVSEGVTKLQSTIDQDAINLQTLPADQQAPVEEVASLFSDPQTTATAFGIDAANNPKIGGEVQTQRQHDLAALDADGQAFVRAYYSIDDYSDAIAGLTGAKQLQVAGDNLVNDQNSLAAVKLSPDALSELTFRGEQQMYASAIQTADMGPDVSGQAWTGQLGFQYLPPGVLWIGRDLTGYYGAVASQGLTGPLTLLPKPWNIPGGNFDPTGTVAQQINDLAQTMPGNAPVSVEAVQAQIAQINDRTITLSFGGQKLPNQGATQRVAALQSGVATDPDNIQIQQLQRRLALTSDPRQRVQILQSISDLNADSVTKQLAWMEQQAGTDKALLGRIADLKQSYAAAQQSMQTINSVNEALLSPPPAENTTVWLNRAGMLAGQDAQNGTLAGNPGGAALEQSLSTLDPATQEALLSGEFNGPVDSLPSEVVDSLQQYATVTAALGTGPKPGLVATTEGGLRFSLLQSAQMIGGAAYLIDLGVQHGGGALDVWFGGGLAAFGVAPSLANLGAAATQKYLVGSDLSNIPVVGDGLTNLLSTGGPFDTTSLFARGVGGGTLASFIGSASAVAWTPMMYIWAAQELKTDPLTAGVIFTIGTSYLLPLVTDSAWAGPVGAVIDIAGIAYVLDNTIYETDKSVHQYSGEIADLLTQAGVKQYVAEALSKPDDQGIAAAPRLGQVFDAVPYYNTSNPQLNDQRRLAYLNSLTPAQATLLSEGLLHMPVDKSGHVNAVGALNLAIPPPPTSLTTPAEIQQYYDDAYSAHGQPLPQAPHMGSGQTVGKGSLTTDYLDYYEMYSASLAATGRTPDASGLWSNVLYANGVPLSPGAVAVMPTTVQGFLYYADLAGISLHGSTP